MIMMMSLPMSLIKTMDRELPCYYAVVLFQKSKKQRTSKLTKTNKQTLLIRSQKQLQLVNLKEILDLLPQIRIFCALSQTY